MSEWKEYKLSDVAEFIDYRGKTPKKISSGVPLITAKIVKNGWIQQPNEFISKEDYLTWMTRGFPNVGDVVLTTEAPLGEVAQIKDASFALAQRIITIRGKSGLIDNGYLKYFLQSSIGQHRLKERETGTTVTGIKSSELRQVLISAPDFQIQTTIAEILSSLDDKIELNNKINRELENLAQTLFKQWFIDFEFPNENGEPYKSSGGEMVESELGEIPKGWEVGNLNQIAELLKKNIKPFEHPDLIYHHYSLPEFDSGKMPSKELGEKILSSKYQVIEHSILVSKLNPRIPRVWTIIKPTPNSICSTEFQVMKPIDAKFFPFVNCLCLSNGYVNSLQSKVTGTSSSHQRVNPNDIINYEMVLPPFFTFNQFYEAVYESFIIIDNNRIENIQLTNLRESLLPKLISGELEINEIKN